MNGQGITYRARPVAAAAQREEGAVRKISPKRSGAGPHVVVIGNHKGGCGKSTVAMHLIVALLKEKRRVASFDLDLTQQTLTRYIENRSEWARLHHAALEV